MSDAESDTNRDGDDRQEYTTKDTLLGLAVVILLGLCCFGGIGWFLGDDKDEGAGSDQTEQLSSDNGHSMNESSASNDTKVPAQESKQFAAHELKQIQADRRLAVAHEMGHLDREEFQRYLTIKEAMKRNGLDVDNNPSFLNHQFLLLIPSKEWANAARRLGLSRDEYRQATNLIIASLLTEKGVDLPPLGDITAFNEFIERHRKELTDESLDEY